MTPCFTSVLTHRTQSITISQNSRQDGGRGACVSHGTRDVGLLLQQVENIRQKDEDISGMKINLKVLLAKVLELSTLHVGNKLNCV